MDYENVSILEKKINIEFNIFLFCGLKSNVDHLNKIFNNNFCNTRYEEQ